MNLAQTLWALSPLKGSNVTEIPQQDYNIYSEFKLFTLCKFTFLTQKIQWNVLLII